MFDSYSFPHMHNSKNDFFISDFIGWDIRAKVTGRDNSISGGDSNISSAGGATELESDNVQDLRREYTDRIRCKHKVLEIE